MDWDKFKVIECYKTSRSIRGNYGELWDWSENSLNFSESGWWGRIFSAMKPIKQQRREYRNGLSWGDFVLGFPVLSRPLKKYRKGTSEGEL